jgi:hypothetical protein
MSRIITRPETQEIPATKVLKANKVIRLRRARVRGKWSRIQNQMADLYQMDWRRKGWK